MLLLNTLVKHSEHVGLLWGKGWEEAPLQKKERVPLASDKKLRSYVLAGWSAASFIYFWFIHSFIPSF